MLNASMNTTNVTTADANGFTHEYAVFNYIMVGISCGLLLFVIIIAKLLCIFNRNSEYDDLDRIGREKDLFATDELENITEPVKRSSPVLTSAASSERVPASIIKPRSATDYYYGAKGVWHTPQTPLHDDDDYLSPGYETHRLEPHRNTFHLVDGLQSQSAPDDESFLSRQRKPRLHRALTADHTSNPDFNSLASRDTET